MEPQTYKLNKFLSKDKALRDQLKQLRHDQPFPDDLYTKFESVYALFCDLSFDQKKDFFTYLLTKSFIETKAEMDHYLIHLLNNMFEHQRTYLLYLLAKIYRLAQHKRLYRPIIKHIFSTFKIDHNQFKFMRFTHVTQQGNKKYYYKVIKKDKYKLVKKYIQRKSQ